MADANSLLNKHQRKKIRRKAKKTRERQAGRDLRTVTSQAIDMVMAFVPELTGRTGELDTLAVGPDQAPRASRHQLDVSLMSVSEAQFVRKRINERLMIEELLDLVSIEIDDRADTPTLWIAAS